MEADHPPTTQEIERVLEQNVHSVKVVEDPITGMNTDAYFTIGSSHTVCQDYARAGQGYAFVSDGCSGSPDTDIGARLLVLGAANLYQQSKMFDLNNATRKALLFLPEGVSRQCLDATLLSLTQWGGDVLLGVAGDGVYAALRRDGVLEVMEIEFSGNAPAYPIYLFEPERLQRYLSQTGWGVRRTRKYLDGRLVGETSEQLRESGMCGHFAAFPCKDYRAVFAFTDGVHSFQRKNENGIEPVPMLEVVQHLTAIKSFTGQFMQRRVRAFLDRHCKQHGWTHYDDLGCAAIDLGE